MGGYFQQSLTAPQGEKMKNARRGSVLFFVVVSLGFAAHALDAPLILAQGLPGQLPGQKLPGQLPGPSSLPSKPATTAPLSAGAALPPSPCCSITAINKTTGIVSAREKNGSRTIEIKVTPAQLQNLRVGQDLFANLETKKASLDGKTLCCDLVFAVAAPSPAAPATTLSAVPQTPAKQPAPAKTASADAVKPASSPTVTGSHQLPGKALPGAPQFPAKAPEPASSTPPARTAGTLLGVPAMGGPAHATTTPAKGSPVPEAACCAITKIDKPTGIVTAKSGAPIKISVSKPQEGTFEFHVTDAKQLQGLKVGQNVFVNHETGDVSLDGKTLCCKIMGVRAGAGVTARAASEPLPQLSAGVRRPAAPANKGEIRIAPRSSNPNIVHLEGVEGIRAATGLPEGAKDFLVMHARTLEAHEHDSYVVNRKLAEEWFKTHPVPASVSKAAKDDGKKKRKGCSTKHLSTGCVKNEVQQSLDDLTRTWRTAWKDTTDEAARAWNKATDCFADHDLGPLKIPVKFSVAPEFPVTGQRPGVKGTVTIGVPVNGDFTAQLKLFYIPCLPFAVRPNTLGADGTMEAGATMHAALVLSGQFDHTFVVPPQGVKVPIEVIPIVIGGVPVAEMDVSIYVEGTVRVSGKGTLNGDVKLQNMQKTAFDFDCSGHGCNLNHHGVPTKPATAVESIKLDGRIVVKPAIYTALQLSFDWQLLEARAGPQPFLLGEVYGCVFATATQTKGAATTTDTSHSIVADLDWGLDIRAEALAGKKQLVSRIVHVDVSPGTTAKTAHLYFKDLEQSTGLVPTVTGALQAAIGQTTNYMITMPECYPYRDAPDNTMQYKVTWTGGASATTGAPGRGAGKPDKAVHVGMAKATSGDSSAACTFEGGAGICRGGPTASTSFNLAWPASGDYTVTVTPVDDKHGHKFDVSRAKQLNVRVQ